MSSSSPPIFRVNSSQDEKLARVRSIMSGLEDPSPDTTPLPPSDAERTKAAGTIQRNYRGHRARRQLQGLSLDPQTRWLDTVKDAQYQALTTPAPPTKQDTGDEASTATGQSLGRSRWTHATKIAQRAGADDDSISGSSLSDSQTEDKIAKLSPEEKKKRNERRAAAKAARKKTARMMGLEYFLEMVDQKHRYGSHLRKYHAHWMTLDTKESFFYWLDYGDGLNMDMPECTRKKLDKEQVRYLSRAERLNYMVKIGPDGLLRWAKNGELVWTKDELYKDSINGIVRTDENVPEYKYNIPPPGAESSDSESESEDESEKGQSLAEKGRKNDDENRYVNEEFHRAKGPEKLKYVSAGVLFNHMIRTSMKKGHKWIFVADTSFNLYIGYKQSGAFQHSSFMHGSRIAAAGVVKVKHGQLRSLAPLSGHYRPPAENFKSFVHSLEEEGCDMSRVNISKSYAILIGMEKYLGAKRTMKGAKSKVAKSKDRVFNPEKVKAEEEGKIDKSQSARLEREWLEREREKQAEAQGARKGSAGGLIKRLTGKLRIGSSSSINSNSSNTGGKKEKDKNKPEVESLPVAKAEVAENFNEIGDTGPEDGVPPAEGNI